VAQVPVSAAVPGGAPSGPSPSSASPPARDLSPLLASGRSGPATPAAAAAESGLPEELALGDIFPLDGSIPAAVGAPDAPAPAGPAPAGEAIADYGHARHGHWALVAGMVVSLSVLVIGAALVWWRNRDSRYWPA